MKTIAAVLFIALMAVGLAAPAEGLIDRRSYPIQCDLETKLCVMAAQDLEAIRRNSFEMGEAIERLADRVRELEQENAGLKEAKRGRLEVIPSRPPAPLPPGSRRT